jgi:uncharacterized protein YbbC (DUF1343 family)
MSFAFGIDNLLNDSERLTQLRNARVGLVAHPASVTSNNEHSIDALMKARCNIVRAFGPQHGMRGDKQDNMIESPDYQDQLHQLPVTSLYGAHRRPSDEMIEDLDIVLFDLQDVGCRIYTYITTLLYFVEVCAHHGKSLWVLDRPNPAGRPVDGLYLEQGQESFVGCAPMPTRHGLTVGELSQWMAARIAPGIDLKVIAMTGYQPSNSPGFGWPTAERPWINPSPNAASINMTRCFPGSVLLEGTTLSEGRGTTIPLEVIGAPNLPVQAILDELRREAPAWLTGVYIRECFFSPTFHKHAGELCHGIQLHTDYPEYDHEGFKPYRLFAGLLKATRNCLPDEPLWRYHEYEYELDRTPIDVINGGSKLRDWVDNSDASYEEMDEYLGVAESQWLKERLPHLIYQ